MSPPTLSWPAVGVARACSSVRPNAAMRRTSRCWARYESSASRSSTTGRTFPGIRRSLQLERRPVGHPREEVEATVARYVAARERIDAGNGTWADAVADAGCARAARPRLLHPRRMTTARGWARPVVHWEIEALDADRIRDFYRDLFNWDIGDGPIMQIAAGLGGPEPGPAGHIR